MLAELSTTLIVWTETLFLLALLGGIAAVVYRSGVLRGLRRRDRSARQYKSADAEDFDHLLKS